MLENQKASTTIKLKTNFKQPAKPQANGGKHNPAKAKVKPIATVRSNKGTMNKFAISAIGATVPKCQI